MTGCDDHSETAAASARFADREAMKFGLRIKDDLRVPLEEGDRAELKRLFLEHGLLLFPGQDLSMSEQVSVMESIGALVPGPDAESYVSTDKEKGELGRTELIYHSDLDFSEHPYKAISLLAVDVPPGTTSTRFANNRRAFEQLDPQLKRRLEGTKLVTALPLDFTVRATEMEITNIVPHVLREPIVRHHDSGQLQLMVSEQAVRFEGMPREQSMQLLDDVQAAVYAPDNVFEHFWKNGDLIIWDNVIFQHARGDLGQCAARTLQRVVIGDFGYNDICPEIHREFY